MGSFGLTAAEGLVHAGTGLSAAGVMRQAEAQRNAAKFNARVVQEQTNQQVAKIRADSRRQTATNVTRVAKSGVRLSGSPLLEIAESINQAERQAGFVQQAGAMQRELFRSQARNAKTAGRVGVASSVLGGLGQIGALRIKHRGGLV